ncbi:MAG TPA: TetR/AcrR family transcriptional regulator [Pseudorhodoplanes sp.]|jgi:AcrR family transcriptional regulator|nr:TetR/AcrR family transcriptional regulator [Pseudorhodoplanes sp.]
MSYRRTDNVIRRMAARQNAILKAARDAAAEGGMEAVQVMPVAERAGIAAGTVYRYFPSKTDLVAALVGVVAEQELSAMRRAASAAPGPLSALCASIVTFASRALRARRLVFALLAEPADPQVAALRQDFRKSIAAEFEARIATAMAYGHFPEQDTGRAAAALIGAVLEGLVGPLARPAADAATERDAVQTVTLLSLRALGVNDPRARGLVVQTALPPRDHA